MVRAGNTPVVDGLFIRDVHALAGLLLLGIYYVFHLWSQRGEAPSLFVSDLFCFLLHDAIFADDSIFSSRAID